MKKIMSLILCFILICGLCCGCRKDITELLINSETVLSEEYNNMESIIDTLDIAKLEEYKESNNQQIDLLKQELDSFKQDDTEYKAITELINVFNNTNNMLTITINFINNPLSMTLLSDNLETQLDTYTSNISNSYTKYIEYKEELKIYTNVNNIVENL